MSTADPTAARPVFDTVFDAVIFDMDGTLIDSTPAVERAWRQWAVEFDVTVEQLLGHHGQPSGAVVRALVDELRVPAAIARINELEILDVHDIVVLPGAAEALATLLPAKVAIATSCTAGLAAARIEAAGLVPPDVLVTVDDVRRGKPAPDPFLTAAARLGVDPTRTLVVEDAPAGLTAGRDAGAATLAVVTTTSRAELVADAVVADLSAVRFEVTADGVRVHLHP